MTKHMLRNILLGSGFFIIWLIATLPAVQVIPRAIPDNVAVADISGTIWQGEIGMLQTNGVLLQSVKWTLSPWALLTGKLSAQLNVGNMRDKSQISMQGNVTASMDGEVRAEELNGFIPAHIIASNSPYPLPMQVGGRVKFNVAQFSTGTPYCEALQADVSWLNAQVQGISGMLSLGSLDAALNCDEGAVVAKMEKSNKLGLRGQLRMAEKISVEALARPAANMPREIHQGFEMFARKDAQGSYSIKF